MGTLTSYPGILIVPGALLALWEAKNCIHRREWWRCADTMMWMSLVAYGATGNDLWWVGFGGGLLASIVWKRIAGGAHNADVAPEKALANAKAQLGIDERSVWEKFEKQCDRPITAEMVLTWKQMWHEAEKLRATLTEFERRRLGFAELLCGRPMLADEIKRVLREQEADDQRRAEWMVDDATNPPQDDSESAKLERSEMEEVGLVDGVDVQVDLDFIVDLETSNGRAWQLPEGHYRGILRVEPSPDKRIPCHFEFEREMKQWRISSQLDLELLTEFDDPISGSRLWSHASNEARAAFRERCLVSGKTIITEFDERNAVTIGRRRFCLPAGKVSYRMGLATNPAGTRFFVRIYDLYADDWRGGRCPIDEEKGEYLGRKRIPAFVITEPIENLLPLSGWGMLHFDPNAKADALHKPRAIEVRKKGA